jgi:hypothetical protein
MNRTAAYVCPLLIVLAFPPTTAAEPEAVPVVMGVCTAGSYHHMRFAKKPWTFDAFWEAVKELGAEQVNFNSLIPITHLGDRNSQAMREKLAALDAAARKHGMRYTIGLEHPNFVSSAEITPGVNEYAHSDGRHFWLLRREWIDPLLDQPTDREGLQAIVYDEAEHMQLSNNKYANSKADFDQPFFVNTHGMSIETAYERLVEESRRIRVEQYGNRFQLNTEQVWPDLFHIFARAGWTATPKFLKEHFTPVVASVALSAAVQYQDGGSRFWVSPDLWGVLGYPGHSPEALRSALLMGYWLGAECVYVENLDYPGRLKGGAAAEPGPMHPEAEPGGSLLIWEDANTYRLTPYGEVYRWFARDYLPKQSRTVDWRTYRPRVAIIRLPDGGWGQFGDETGSVEAASRNRLLGNREMPLDEPASEWLHVWPILTHGVLRAGAISYNNPFVYPEPMDFFVPIDSVGVFDHLVRGSVLDSVRCFIVCGHALSRETFDDICWRVEKGDAVCIISRRLYEPYANARANSNSDRLAGDWLVVDSFTDPAVGEALQPFLGPSDQARYTFADQIVSFHKSDAPDSITVQVTRLK